MPEDLIGVYSRGKPDSAAGVGALVRSRRRDAGLTQRELALAAGIAVGSLRDLEQGRTRQLRLDSMTRVAKVLDAGGRVAVGPIAAELTSSGGLGSGEELAPERGVRLSVLGSLEVAVDGERVYLAAPKQRAVLGLLVLNPNVLVHRETLIDAVWGEDPPAAAVNLVQSYVGRLRRILDAGRGPRDRAGLILSAGTSYRLQVTAAHLDSLAFDQFIARARDERASGDDEAAYHEYEQALSLWRGEPVADVDALRSHLAVIGLRNGRTAAVLEYAEIAVNMGRHEPALPHLAELAEREPLNERAHALLMIALAGGGQQAAALGVFDDISRRLDDELGIRPGDELSAARLLVVRQEVPLRGLPRPAANAAVTPRQLPAPVADFVGRGEELTALHGLLRCAQDRGTTVTPLIVGAAGVGKTTLALYWASQLAGQFPAGQIYLNLRGFDPSGTPVSPHAAIRGVLDAFGVPAARIPAIPDAQIGLYRSLLADRRVLIVLDNAWAEDQVRPLLPGSPGCLVVVTSRRRLTGLVVSDGAKPLELGVLGLGEARDLLASRVGGNRAAADPVAADDLIGRCARLPLALAIAGARAAARPGRPLATLAAEIKDGRGHLDALDTADPATSIRAVFSWSYDGLSASAARMFRLLALHPGPDTAIRAAVSLADREPAAVRRALTELTDAHLVAESSSGRLGFHDVLRAYAAEQSAAVDSRTEAQAAIGRMVDYYTHTAHLAARLVHPIEDPGMPLPPLPAGLRPDDAGLADHAGAMDWLRAERQVLLRVIAVAADAGLDAQAWLLAWSLGGFLEHCGYFQDWIATQRSAQTAAERIGDPALLARTCRSLAWACLGMGKHGDALKHLRTGLSLCAQMGDRSGQARSLLDTGGVLGRLNQPGKALGCCIQALRLFEATADPSGQAAALNGIGWYHAKLGAYRKAVDYCQRALALYQSLDENCAEALTWDSLGYAYHCLGDYGQAITSYESALRLFAENGTPRIQAEMLRHLADTHQQAGNPDGASAARDRAAALVDYAGR